MIWEVGQSARRTKLESKRDEGSRGLSPLGILATLPRQGVVQ